MTALQEFRVTATFCFTPEHRGIKPHHTSPPLEPAEFAEFCARMVRRFAPAPAHEAGAPARGRQQTARVG
jgi:beta-xylosidase